MSRPGRAWLAVEEGLKIRQYDERRDHPNDAFVVVDAKRADANAKRLSSWSISDAEIEAAANAIHNTKTSDHDLRRFELSAARSALIAAREVSCPESASSTETSQPSASTDDSSSPRDAGHA